MTKPSRGSQDAHHTYEELSAGYVLHALEPEDEATFLAHLGNCAACRASVSEWQVTATHLAHAADQASPPPELRERLLAAISDEAAAPGSKNAPLLASPVPVSLAGRRSAQSVPSQGGPGRTRGRVGARRQITISTRLLAAAAAVTALVAGGVVLDQTRVDAGHTRSQLAAAEAVINAMANHNARTIDLGSAGSSSAKAVVLGRQVWLVASGLPKNDAHTSIYVLWTVNSAQRMVPISAFDVSQQGAPTIVRVHNLPDNVDDKVFAVSLEQGRVAPSAPSRPVLGPNTA